MERLRAHFLSLYVVSVADEPEYGALLEWDWQRKTVGLWSETR